MFENASNEKTTNIFESYTGHLNIAPTRISGQYKIVMTVDGNLWLDDYNNRRVPVDLTKKFLPQVANFLKIKTEIVEIDNTRYGGFQRLTTKSFHVPLYLNTIRFKERLPNYYTLARVVNEEIDQEYKLQKYGMIVQVIDLEKCGIRSIMQEIIDECPDYPVYFNLEDENYTIGGYSIDEECWKEKTINTLRYQANQPYVDVFNNRIMMSYKENGMFFPRFINLEFDFEFTDDIVPFNNFYGYMSYGEEITVDEFNPDLFTINVQDYNDYIVWKQEKYPDKIAIEKYRREIGNISTVKSSIQLPQVRFRCSTINVEDVFTIINPDGTIYFQHVVLANEIYNDSLYKTLVQLCKKMTIENGRNFEFSVNEKLIITITSNISDIYEEQYSVQLPKYCVVLDRFDEKDKNYYKFRGVTSYDVKLYREASFAIDTTIVEINKNYFNIVEKFKYDDQFYIRCVGIENPNEYPVIKEMDTVLFFEILDSVLYRLPPLPYYTVNSLLKALRQFSKQDYIAELKKMFGEMPENPTEEQEFANKKFWESITDFEKQDYSDTLPYIAEDENIGEPVENDVVVQDDNNDEEIKTMMFNSTGQTSMLTPNIMNIDKHFYIRNGCNDYNNVDTDPYAFHWFLIKGKCPEYLKNDIRSTRYFGGSDDTRPENERLPKITSRVIRVNEDYCETIFLGVKYRLPLKYEDWQFSTYIDFQNTLDFDTVYKFEIDERVKTMYLVISRYIDFVDLIRGGNVYNEPLLDLSFLYSVKAAYNTQSEFLDGFTSTGILMCDETIPVMFNGRETTDWKAQKNNKWYVCLKNSMTTQSVDFRELFPETGSHEFYLYCDVTYNGRKYSYISMSIKLKNINELDENYVWCEDVQVKFFDTREFFIQKLKDGVEPPEQEWFQVNRSNVINYVDQTSEIYGDYVKTATVLIRRYVGEEQVPVDTEEVFELILPAKTLSLVENYFEITRKVTPKTIGNGELEVTYGYFKFPNFFKQGWELSDLLGQFEIESFDNDTRDSRITLFDRNQIWLFIKEYMSTDARFKYSTEEQIRRLINNFLVDNLNTYTNYKSIPVRKFNDTVDELETDKYGFVPLKVVSTDYNSVIWNIITHAGYNNKIFTINRYKSAYLPYLKLLDNIVDFQKLKYSDTGKIYNVYDPDFAGKGLSATTFWNEVQGNIVSSLFCKDSDIVITIVYSETVNWREMFKSQLSLDEAIINSDNAEYIKTIDENVNEYIIEKYTDYLLFRFYYLAKVENELGQRLRYTTDQKNANIIHFAKLSSYDTYFHYMKLVFSRKK